MTTLRGGLFLALVAAVTAGLRAGDERDEKKREAARKEVLGLVRDLESKKDITRKAAAVAKKHELEHIKWGLARKAKGGIGHGKDGESIELVIVHLGKCKLTAAVLKKEQAELLKAVRVTVAIAEVTA